MNPIKCLAVVLMVRAAAAIDTAPVYADGALEMAKNLQNPLANI